MAMRALTLWRILDDRPGHEKQTSGLMRALADLVSVEPHDIPCPTRRHAWLNLLTSTFPPGAHLPRPDLILLAGHATHVAGLAARRAHGGRLVTLMHPSLPCAWFDLCLIPEHDEPSAAANIVVTRGALNAAKPGGAHHDDRGLILIGGPSEHYAWDDAIVAEQVRRIVSTRSDAQWRLSTSRRTPDSFAARLAGIRPANLTVYTPNQTAPGWVESALADAGQAWVTEDSVSMLYEALTAGCHVGLLRLPRLRTGRVARGVDKLIADGWVTPMENWDAGLCAAPPNATFNEAGRCARLILEKWFPNAA